MFFYGSPLLYVENEPFFSRDIFRRFDVSSSKQQQASPEHSIYLYDPVDIIVENSFSSEAAHSQDWCTQLEFSLDQVNTRGCNAISIWRLALFYEKHGHLNVLSDQQISDGLHGQQVFPKSGAFFGYLARVLVSDEPPLLQHYLDLELSSLLLGTQIDAEWLKRVMSPQYKADDFLQELRMMFLKGHQDTAKINSLSDELTQVNEAANRMKFDLNSISISLEAAHEELDFYYNKNEDKSKLLDDYSIALKKAMQIIGKQQ